MPDSEYTDPRDDPRFVDLQGDSKAVELHEMLLACMADGLFVMDDEEDWWRAVEFFGRTREVDGRRKGLIEVIL